MTILGMIWMLADPLTLRLDSPTLAPLKEEREREVQNLPREPLQLAVATCLDRGSDGELRVFRNFLYPSWKLLVKESAGSSGTADLFVFLQGDRSHHDNPIQEQLLPSALDCPPLGVRVQQAVSDVANLSDQLEGILVRADANQEGRSLLGMERSFCRTVLLNRRALDEDTSLQSAEAERFVSTPSIIQPFSARKGPKGVVSVDEFMQRSTFFQSLFALRVPIWRLLFHTRYFRTKCQYILLTHPNAILNPNLHHLRIALSRIDRAAPPYRSKLERQSIVVDVRRNLSFPSPDALPDAENSTIAIVDASCEKSQDQIHPEDLKTQDRRRPTHTPLNYLCTEWEGSSYPEGSGRAPNRTITRSLLSVFKGRVFGRFDWRCPIVGPPRTSAPETDKVTLGNDALSPSAKKFEKQRLSAALAPSGNPEGAGILPYPAFVVYCLANTTDVPMAAAKDGPGAGLKLPAAEEKYLLRWRVPSNVSDRVIASSAQGMSENQMTGGNDSMAIVAFVPGPAAIGEGLKAEKPRVPYLTEFLGMLYPSWRYVIGDSLPGDLASAPQPEAFDVRDGKFSQSWKRMDLLVFADKSLGDAFPPSCVKAGNLTSSELANMVENTYGRRLAERLAEGKSALGASVCVVIPFAVSHDHYWQRNKFMFSYEFLRTTDFDALLMRYHRILRSDGDVFVTPVLRWWKPVAPVVAGRAGYGDPYANRRLREVSWKLGLRHQGVHNIGSTWFIEPSLLLRCTTLLLAVAQHLLEHEYTAPEPISWPQWWPGVTSMYAGEIALNHFVDAEGIHRVPNLLDVPSSAVTDSILRVPHLHCWQTDDPFSKFFYLKGSYREWTPSQWEGWWTNRTARGYAFFIALSYGPQLN
jgi:hypothetical protein